MKTNFGCSILGNLREYFFSEQKEKISLDLLTICIVFYGIRSRDGGQIIWMIENICFIASVGAFPWKKLDLRKMLFAISLFYSYSLLTWFLYYPTKNDLIISFVNVAMVTKCLIVAILIAQYHLKDVVIRLNIAIFSIVLWSLGWLIMYGFNTKLGFSAGMGDRNYFVALLLCLLASLWSSFECSQDFKKIRFSYDILQSLIFGLILLSVSRSGLLAALWLLVFSNKRSIWLIVCGLVATLYFFGLLDPLIYRIHHTIVGSDDRIRVMQYLAFLNAYKAEPLALLTGFGPMASSHLAWFSSAYAGEDLKKYLHIIHNTSLDLVFSLGISAIWVLYRVWKALPWKIFIFTLLISSFNNLLAFFPFYLFLGVAMSAYRTNLALSDQY